MKKRLLSAGLFAGGMLAIILFLALPLSAGVLFQSAPPMTPLPPPNPTSDFAPVIAANGLIVRTDATPAPVVLSHQVAYSEPPGTLGYTTVDQRRQLKDAWQDSYLATIDAKPTPTPPYGGELTQGQWADMLDTYRLQREPFDVSAPHYLEVWAQGAVPSGSLGNNVELEHTNRGIFVLKQGSAVRFRTLPEDGHTLVAIITDSPAAGDYVYDGAGGRLGSIVQLSGVTATIRNPSIPPRTSASTAYQITYVNQEFVVASIDRLDDGLIVGDTTHDIYIGPPAAGDASGSRYISLEDLEGSIVVASGRSLIWRDTPPIGFAFTIVINSDSYPLVESADWNGTDGSLFRRVAANTTVRPYEPWSYKLRTGDVLDVTVEAGSRVWARPRNERTMTIGSGGDLLIVADRAYGQRGGVWPRAAAEMHGKRLLVEQKETNAITNIMLNWNQSAYTFPKGWLLDFYNVDDTPIFQEASFAPGQVVWPGPGQTWTYGPDRTAITDNSAAHPEAFGPFKGGTWYRIIAVADNHLHIDQLNRLNLPTATPHPTPTPRGWRQAYITQSAWLQPGVSSISNSCGSAVRYWPGTSDNSNSLGAYTLANPTGWQFLRITIHDAAVNVTPIPGRQVTIIIPHPGTTTDSVTIAGTPTPVDTATHHIFGTWGLRIHSQPAYGIIMYIYDTKTGGEGGRSRQLSSFSATDVSSEDRCFADVQEY